MTQIFLKKFKILMPVISFCFTSMPTDILSVIFSQSSYISIALLVIFSSGLPYSPFISTTNLLARKWSITKYSGLFRFESLEQHHPQTHMKTGLLFKFFSSQRCIEPQRYPLFMSYLEADVSPFFLSLYRCFGKLIS